MNSMNLIPEPDKSPFNLRHPQNSKAEWWDESYLELSKELKNLHQQLDVTKLKINESEKNTSYAIKVATSAIIIAATSIIANIALLIL